MNDFKEWLSDYLRYFLLAFAILAVVAIAILGITIYKKVANPTPEVKQTESQVQTEAMTDESETDSEKVTEKETNTETKETDSEALESESGTEAGTDEESESSSSGETENDPEYLKLTTNVNLRSGPGTDYEVIESYGAGQIAKFLAAAGDWYKIRIGGQDGYMSAQYLQEVAYEEGMEAAVETAAEPEAPTPIYKTLKASCYLRAETSKESQILGTYYTGATVQFLEDVGGWYRVQVDGMTGYMGAQFF